MRIRSLLIALSLTASPLACPAQTAEPAYAWRGCMIDVARHFFPLSFVERQIDVLAAHGINRLHFHLTDNGGWRVEMPQYPRLTSLAAWRTESDWDKWWVGEDRRYLEQGTPGAYGGFYTQAELRGLVDYAKKRGIEIVPEIEMPGHSEEVLAAYPELGCLGATRKTGDICPANPKAYEFFENVLTEIIDIFPSEYIHIGGDEAGQSAWKTCERCQKLLAELGADDVDALQAHFVRKMAQFVASKGRKAMGWDEIIYPDMPAGTAITVWRNAAHAKRAIAAGLDVVMCPTSHAYLDYYQDVPDKEPRAIGGYVPLAKTYALNPTEGLTADEARHVLGVQGNLWTEYIPTKQQAEYMLYPRIFAIAEIGLKGEARPPYAQFRKRMIREVGALRKSGVNAFDLKHESGPRKESPQARAPQGSRLPRGLQAPIQPLLQGGGHGHAHRRTARRLPARRRPLARLRVGPLLGRGGRFGQTAERAPRGDGLSAKQQCVDIFPQTSALQRLVRRRAFHPHFRKIHAAHAAKRHAVCHLRLRGSAAAGRALRAHRRRGHRGRRMDIYRRNHREISPLSSR